ncbi:MAG: acyltransferase family protein [Muribaculaceae bacterium]
MPKSLTLAPISSERIRYRGGDIAGLQVLKLLCAIMVVQLHVPLLDGEAMQPLCRAAVPVFYIISGFFLTDSDGIIDSGKLRHALCKILKITAIAVAVYMAYSAWALPLRFWQNVDWFDVIALGAVPSGGHLWYLFAYIEALAVLLVLKRLKAERLIWVIAAAGICYNLLCGQYAFVLGMKSLAANYTRTFYGIALPCLAIGIALRRHECSIAPRAIALMPFAAIALLILSYAEFYLLKAFVPADCHIGNTSLATVPLAASLFIIARNASLPRRLCFVAKWGKAHSTNIYLWHIIVRKIEMRLWPALPYEYAFLVVLPLTLLLSYAINRVTRLCKKCRRPTTGRPSL